MKSKLAWMGLVAGGLAAAYWYQLQSRQIANLQHEVESLHDEQQSRLTWISPPASSPRLAAPSDHGAVIAALPTAESGEAETVIAREKSRPTDTDMERWEKEAASHRAAVEDRFSSEPTDGAWASKARGDVSNHLAALLPATSSLRQVECRSTICRVEVVHPSVEVSRNFVEQSFGLSSNSRVWNGAFMIEPETPNSDGTLASVIYLGREGTQLVKLDL